MDSSNHPLRKYRNRFDPPMSQTSLGNLIGVSKPTVSRWESRQRNIDVTLLLRVVSVTGIPARELRPDLADAFEPPSMADPPFACPSGA